MPHATVYLEQEDRDKLDILREDERFEELPEVVKILIRLYFMWEEADGSDSP